MATDNPPKWADTGENIGTPVSLSIGESGEENSIDGINNRTNAELFTVTALSNVLVLRYIFSNLDNQDLDTCCQLSKLWNTIADPLLVRYYDIKLVESFRTFYSDPNRNQPDYSCFITKRRTYNTAEVRYTSYSLEATTELLDQVVAIQKVAINLSLPRQDATDALTAFMSRFGRFVEKLGIAHFSASEKFVQFLPRYFPNVKHLNLSETRFRRDDAFEGSPPQTLMKKLRRIDLGNKCQTDSILSVANIFRLAPNLEEIHDLPTCLLNAADITGKTRCVKSLNHPKQRDEAFLPAVQKLDTVGSKLHSFSFEYLQPWSSDLVPNTVAQTEPFVRRIFQSSHDSLETLALCKSESFDFNAIPPMSSVTELHFFLQQSLNMPIKCFPIDTNLENLFPNVSAMKIFTRLARSPFTDITTWFPKDQFVPWGLRIEKLMLIDVTVHLLRQLRGLFPAVKTLEFCIWDRTNEIKVLLAAVAECWPEVQSITVIVTYDTYACCGLADGQECSFDSAFTGFPDKVLAHLRDPASRRDHFSSEEIEKLKEESTIRKLSMLLTFLELKTLVFQLERGLDSKFLQKLAAISPVSKEFGFQFLPELKIRVRAMKSNLFYSVINVLAVKTPLESIVDLDIEVVP